MFVTPREEGRWAGAELALMSAWSQHQEESPPEMPAIISVLGAWGMLGRGGVELSNEREVLAHTRMGSTSGSNAPPQTGQPNTGLLDSLLATQLAEI